MGAISGRTLHLHFVASTLALRLPAGHLNIINASSTKSTFITGPTAITTLIVASQLRSAHIVIGYHF
jgi:hypothetical protein